MPSTDALLLAVLILAVAALYSSVGHAGASGYLALMALFGVPTAVMKPTALVLNILVASIGTVRFTRAGHFHWPTLWPFLLGSVPLAFLGGALRLPGSAYRPLVGLVLLWAAVRLVQVARGAGTAPAELRPVSLAGAIPTGAGIGLLSGLTGTGGGIFLSPVLLLARWAEPRRTAAISAAFILANSLAGLTGNLASVGSLPRELPLWAGAAGVGGLVGARLGSGRLPTAALRYLLAVALVVAGLKLLLTR